MGQDRAVLVLLPPSEGKSAPRRGRPLDLATLSFPELTETRQALTGALSTLASEEPAGLRAVLGLSERQHDEIARDADLLTAPTARAADIYAGVLYDALALHDLDPTARRRANRSLVVMSALFGALRLNDRIPPYRLSADTDLPGVGPVGRAWREPLARALPDAVGRGPLLDLRSSAYAAMWPPPAGLADRTMVIRVLQERRVGGVLTRSVVSHFNKATKGRLVRALLLEGADPRSVDEVVIACAAVGFNVEPGPSPAPGKPHRLDVVVREL
jgi:cytoplasmic iron level regulating protein YaaA (DUF328/UPF0246 family)